MPERTLAERLAGVTLDLTPALIPHGTVSRVADGVAQVSGLMDVGADELVALDSGGVGMAYELGIESAGVVLLSGADAVRVGDGVRGLGRLPSIPVGSDLLGRVVDPLGRALDGRSAPGGRPAPVFAEAPSLSQRAPVTEPLHTGVMVIDSAIPIGRGQRQLIVGDRNVGKTALALDLVAAQRTTGVLCVYVTIGQPVSRVMGIREALDAQAALSHVILIAAEASDTPGLQYLAPYAGMSVAEFFRDRGRDVLVVLDDLTKHADAYRELALLLGRPAGREAFPGDIFYVHAQLLERSTAMAKSSGGGSITTLPIVETTDSDISSYIPTNLISITDGQLYLDAPMFEKNQRPAVDIGRSVSRVGGAAQSKVLRSAARNLRITMSRFETLESLTRVGLDVDPATRQAVERGRAVRELLRQPRFSPKSNVEQIVALLAVSGGVLDGLPLRELRDHVYQLVRRCRAAEPGLCEELDAGSTPREDWQSVLVAVLTDR
ncbi:MAG: F0F1 ATP synthase subunit alpha [Myxococcales bacterium]|nr:F0F1 ATP synthase subunit alpha [Myxococcales bacterium]